MDKRDKDRIIWNLRSLPNELDDLLNGLDEETMRWRPIPTNGRQEIIFLKDMYREAYLARYTKTSPMEP